jgi:hypothetical protein
VAAQTTLERVDRYAHQGLTEAARDLLIEWFDEESEGAPEGALKHALWLRGVLTVDPIEAAEDFERLADEFGGGALAEDATVRLARMGVLVEEPERSAWAYRLILEEYPESEFRDEARRWLEQAPAPAASGEPPATEVPESGATEDEDPTRAEPEPFRRADMAAPRDGSSSAGTTGAFTVQVAAYAQVGPAAAMAVRLRDEGFDARMVRLPDSGLILVRVGRFDERAEASAVRQRLLQADHDAIVQDDATRERPVG